jgi:hypothetical protein
MKTLKSIVAIAGILCFMLIFSSCAQKEGAKPDAQNKQNTTAEGGQSTQIFTTGDEQSTRIFTTGDEQSTLRNEQNNQGDYASETTVEAMVAGESEAAAKSVFGSGFINLLIVVNTAGIVLILFLLVLFRIIEARKMKSISEKVDKLFYYRNDAINDLKFQMDKLLRYEQNNAYSSPEERKSSPKTGGIPEEHDFRNELYNPGGKNAWEPKESLNGARSASTWDSKTTEGPRDTKESWNNGGDDQEQPFVNQFSKNIQQKTQTKSELFLAQYNKYLSGEIRPQEFFSQYRPEDNIYLKVDVSSNREVQFVSDQSQGQIHVFSHALSDDPHSIAVLNKNEMSSFSTSNIRSMIEQAFDLNGIRDFVNEKIVCVKPAKIKRIKENMYQIVSKGAYKNA